MFSSIFFYLFYKKFEDMVIAMINLNMSYQKIKAIWYSEIRNTPRKRVIATKKA